jgi:hypothetical protein
MTPGSGGGIAKFILGNTIKQLRIPIPMRIARVRILLTDISNIKRRNRANDRN